MKRYEQASRQALPPRTYTIIRVDGRAFHTHLRNAGKPFDANVIAAMDTAAVALCRELSGVCFAYTQSDEISILLADLEPQSEPWFGGSVQKMASVAASIASGEFTDMYRSCQNVESLPRGNKPAVFDGRVYTIPSRIEVANYFLWRQKDAIRNAVSMAAQAHFSHHTLQGVSSSEMQELLWDKKNINFKTTYSDRARRGGVVVRETSSEQRVSWEWQKTHIAAFDARPGPDDYTTVERSSWAFQAAPDFSLDNGGFLALQIPQEPTDALQPDMIPMADCPHEKWISIRGRTPRSCLDCGHFFRLDEVVEREKELAVGDSPMWPGLVGLMDTPEKEECVRQVFEIIGNDDLARAWIIGMNPFLDDLAPATRIGGGFFEDVLAAARIFQNGSATS
jgi:tRNA(His) 5'-end guanylyltransferase